jgi:hypothetical protein
MIAYLVLDLAELPMEMLKAAGWLPFPIQCGLNLGIFIFEQCDQGPRFRSFF